jgi:undecaprenyl-diphosphatase
VGLLLTILAFGWLTVLAYSRPYFELDVPLTRAVQLIQIPWILNLLSAMTWVGMPPQSNVIFGLVILGLFLVGLRLEALGTLLAALGSFGLWYHLAPLINRPRPTPDLVHVDQQLPFGGFPSGHVVNLTSIFGFLFYLVLVHAPPGWGRRLLLALLALPVLTIGLARIHAGAHWPSDVLGGYLLGTLWLSVTIGLYRWAKQRFSKHHQTSEERSALWPGDPSTTRLTSSRP